MDKSLMYRELECMGLLAGSFFLTTIVLENNLNVFV